MLLDCNSSVYLPREEVQELLESNVKAMAGMQAEQLALFNESIMLVNTLTEQKRDIRNLEAAVALREEKIQAWSKRLEDRRGVRRDAEEVEARSKELLAELESFDEVRSRPRRPGLTPVATQRVLRRNQTFDLSKKPPAGLNKTLDAGRDPEDSGAEEPGPAEAVFLESLSEAQLRELHNDLRVRSGSVLQAIQQLKTRLSSASSHMHVFLRNAQNKMNEVFTCKNCFQKFTLMHNQDKLCLFHPGRIKFFSCSKCDNDEYFTCCHLCGDCSNGGCKHSYHVPFTAYNKTKL